MGLSRPSTAVLITEAESQWPEPARFLGAQLSWGWCGSRVDMGSGCLLLLTPLMGIWMGSCGCQFQFMRFMWCKLSPLVNSRFS